MPGTKQFTKSVFKKLASITEHWNRRKAMRDVKVKTLLIFISVREKRLGICYFIQTFMRAYGMKWRRQGVVELVNRSNAG